MTANEESAVLERKVVFATDLEGAVEQGLALATRVAHERAATLVIMHVLPLRRTDGEAMLHSSLSLINDHSDERLRALVPHDSRVPYTHVFAVGDPADEIAQFVASEPVELLVLESRQRSFFHRLWGTDLTDVLRNTTDCAILTYKARAEESPAVVEPRGLVDEPLEALALALDARVDAISRWMTAQREGVARIAGRSSIVDGVAELVQGADDDEPRGLLEFEIGEHCSALGASGFEVVHEHRQILHRGSKVASGERRAALLKRAAAEGSAISLPLEPDPSGERSSHLIMAAAVVPVPDATPALLALVYDARQYFLRILAQPGPTRTAETYAFDADGLMISNSRFPAHLRRLGLLPSQPGAQAPGRVRVADPRGDRETSENGSLPLTRMAVSATAGESDSDWHGYRDYRGVEVVGTWRWIAEHGFGVAAEMDRPA